MEPTNDGATKSKKAVVELKADVLQVREHSGGRSEAVSDDMKALL